MHSRRGGRARANAPLSSFPWSCSSVRQGRACSSVPAYLRDRRSARSLSKARQRHRSHAQTIRAVVIVEHGQEPPFDRQAREGLLSSRRGRAPILTSSAYRGDNPPINRNDLRGARQAASIIAPRPCIRRIFARSQTMMQTCASTAKLRGGGPFLAIGWKARMVSGFTATSDRYRRLVNRPTAETSMLERHGINNPKFARPDAA